MKNLLFLLLFSPFLCNSQLYKVNAKGGLNVRETSGGKKIATLLKDDYVYVYWKSDETLTVTDIDKNTGKSKIINLGTGVNTSVMELLNTFEKVNNLKIPYEITNAKTWVPLSPKKNLFKKL